MFRIADVSKISFRHFHYTPETGLVRSFNKHQGLNQKCLEGKFEAVRIIKPDKTIVHVRDKKFNGISGEKRQEMVMAQLPQRLKKSISLETIPTELSEIDTMLSKVALEHVDVDLYLSNILLPATPQRHIDDAIILWKLGKGALASEAGWGCASLQLKWFLMLHGVDCDLHNLKTDIVDFLLEKFPYKEIETRFGSAWNDLNAAHRNFYHNDRSLKAVHKMLISAEFFSNVLFDLYSNKTVSFTATDLINHVGRSHAKQLSIPIGSEWKKIHEWIKDKKMNLEGEKPDIKIIYP